MLKKLRKKFIIVTMISVILILTAIMVTVNLVNYFVVIDSADEVVDLLLANDGRFPLDSREEPDRESGIPQQNPDRTGPGKSPSDQSGPDLYDLPEKMSKETPFNTRFFSVTYENDVVVSSDVNQIAAVTEGTALEMAEKVYSSKKTSGLTRVGNYAYRYRKQTDGNRTMIVFVDVTQRMEPINGFIAISLIVIGVCVVLLFVAIFLLSKPLLKPIAESYSRQKRFITDAGHELKTPLTIISANNEIQELETGETDCTKAISKQVSRMTAMVKNLTELARMDEMEKLSTERFSISDALFDAAGPFESVYRAKGKKWTINVQNGVYYVGNEAMIRRLFTLLLENASKYSLTFTEVTLTKKGRRICFSVKNDAKGIAAGDQSKCFERFFRSDDARASQTEGSGIGLSTAQEIVRSHKGKISAIGTIDGCFIVNVDL